MKRRNALSLSMLALAMSVSLVPGCEQVPVLSMTRSGETLAAKARTGSLRVGVRFDTTRVVQYTIGDVDHISVTLNSAPFSETRSLNRADLTSGTGSAEFSDLQVRTYTLGATAYNSASESIGVAPPALLAMSEGQAATASLSIVLDPNLTFPEPLPEPTEVPTPTPSPNQLLSLAIGVTDGQDVRAPLAGLVSSLAGNASAGFQNGIGSGAKFRLPIGITVDGSGSIYVADFSNNAIRKVSSTGNVTTMAGNGSAGSEDGVGLNATFDGPRSLAVDSSGTVYVAEVKSRIRVVTAAGAVSTIPTGSPASCVAIDASGTLYYGTGTAIFKKDADSEELIAGSNYSTGWSAGYVDATGPSARFNGIVGLAVDAAGNLYAADSGNARIRKVSSSGIVTTLAGGGNSTNASAGDARSLALPIEGLAVDGSGRVFITDGNRIRMITPSGAAITVAGRGRDLGTEFGRTRGIAMDRSGRLYFTDSDNHGVLLAR